MNSDNGVRSASIVNRMLHDYPAACPLTLLVKHFLSLYEPNEVFTGGLGGYAIVCMVVSFLQVNIIVDLQITIVVIFATETSKSSYTSDRPHEKSCTSFFRFLTAVRLKI